MQSFFDALQNEFFKNMVNYDANEYSRGDIRCEHCGMTYSDFDRTGKFGCPSCYEAFEKRIDLLMQRIQGSRTYEGRVPSRGNGVFRIKHQIKRLRQELNKAVEVENFEQAMILRDQIKSLESSIEGPDSGTENIKKEKIVAKKIKDNDKNTIDENAIDENADIKPKKDFE